MGIKHNDILECSTDTNRIIIQKFNQSKKCVIDYLMDNSVKQIYGQSEQSSKVI